MKIKTRNRLITVLMILSLGMLILNGVVLGFTLFQKSFTFPENTVYVHLQNYLITKFNYIAVISSIFVSLIYIFVSLMSINVEFEKTQSTEIIYFSVFLFGFLLEFLRLFFPILNIWTNCGRMTSLITRSVIFGRTLSALSLLFTIIYSNFENRQYVEQNILTLIAASIFIAATIPLNTGVILPVGLVQLGFGNLIKILLLTIMAVAILALIIKSTQNHFSKQLVTGFILLIAGYNVLIEGYSILTAAIGTLALFYGTFSYLKSLHSQYLWN